LHGRSVGKGAGNVQPPTLNLPQCHGFTAASPALRCEQQARGHSLPSARNTFRIRGPPRAIATRHDANGERPDGHGCATNWRDRARSLVLPGYCSAKAFPLASRRLELRRELAAPAEDVAPRLVDDIQLLAVEGLQVRDWIVLSRAPRCTKNKRRCFPDFSAPDRGVPEILKGLKDSAHYCPVKNERDLI